MVRVFERGFVAAETVSQEAGDTSDCGDADAGDVVYAPVGQFLLQKLDDLPPVDQRLQFGRGAKVLEEIADLVHLFERQDCAKERIFRAFAVGPGIVAVRLHGVLMY